MSNETKLKRCPCCGGKAEMTHSDGDGNNRIRCTECKLQTNTSTNSAHLKIKWDARPSSRRLRFAANNESEETK